MREPSEPTKAEHGTRSERLAAALRANLARRRSQKRARAVVEDAGIAEGDAPKDKNED